MFRHRWVLLALAGAGIVSGCDPETAIEVAPSFAVSRARVVTAARLGTGAVTETVTIVNGTDGTLSGLTASVEYPAGVPQGWLAAALGQTSASREQAATLTLHANPDGLALGVYSALVILDAENAANGPFRVRVELTVQPRPASKLEISTSLGGQVPNGSSLPALTIQALNALDEPVPEAGILITASLDGSGQLLGSVAVPTDAAGKAVFADLVVRGTAGSKALVFSGTGIAESAVPFELVAGAPATMQAASALFQTATAGTAAPEPPSVSILDESGNPVAGVSVSFLASAGSTVVPAGPVMSGADGVAALTTWQLRPLVGENTVEASVGGLAGSPVTFTAVGVTGPAEGTLSTIAASPSTIVAGEASTVTVTARDGGGNPVSGAIVVLAVAGGGSLTQPAGPTDADGVATGSYTGTAAGVKIVSATVDGVPLATTATISVVPGPPASISALSATSLTVFFGQPVTPVPSVRLTDAFGNPIVGAPVSFGVTRGVSVLSQTVVNTGVSGVATLGSWTVSAVASANFGTLNVYNDVRASVGGAGVAGNPVTFAGTASVKYTNDIANVVNAPGVIGLTSGCQDLACHNAGLRPLTYAALTAPAGQPATYLIAPGDSTVRNAGYNRLLAKLTGVITHGGGTRAANLVTLFAAWIRQGAPN